jgi:hypothetical protein
MWKALRFKAMWYGAEPPESGAAPPRALIDGRERVVRKPLSAVPLADEEPEILPVRIWLAARRRAGPEPEDFPVRFWLAARRLVRDPVGRSIDVESCIAYFGDDLLRYVPTPKLSMAGIPTVVRSKRRTRIKRGAAFLDGFRWDEELSSGEDALHVAFARELASGIPYRGTDSYAVMAAMMRAGTLENNKLPLDTQDKLDRYCAYMQWMIGSVQRHGLRPRGQASGLHEHAFADVREDDKEAGEKDIRVAVDARGTFLRVGSGRHRVAVAQALGIPEVPAQIRLVHVAWIRHLTREYGVAPHAALRRWLGCFRPAAGGADPAVRRSDGPG